MRRHAPSLFTLCASLSLLLGVATCVLWMRSASTNQSTFDKHVARAAAHQRLVNDAIERAGAHIDGHPLPTESALQRTNELTADMNRLVAEQNRLINLVISSLPRPSDYHGKVLALTAVLPIVWLAHRRFLQARNAQRLADGLCPSCGYDLRASPERCPECGASALTKVAA